MLQIYNLKDRPEFIEEVATLTQKEWGQDGLTKEQFNNKVNKKIEKIKNSFENKFYCKLILVENNTLIGFISIFPTDGEERKDLSPWYATMFVKEEYRRKGYSKILNNAILEEAKRRGLQRLYLKTDLENYYEKFGAKYIENLSNGEKLYCIEV